MSIASILAAVFLGWAMGANNSGNIFGAAVAAQMVRWRTAAILIAIFAVVGALTAGSAGLETYSLIAPLPGGSTALAVCLAAALAVALLTVCKIPISASQAVVGAILGVAFSSGTAINFAPLAKVLVCWIVAPFAACLLAIILYPALAALVRRLNPHFMLYDQLLRQLLIAAGIYAAYAFGANNVANVTGVFYQAGIFGNLPEDAASAKFLALLVGGVSIGFGALTYSRGVMLVVGRGVVRLDAFGAFIVVASLAIAIHACALVGVPVSTGQAAVGAIFGIGILKGVRTLSFPALFRIILGWLLTPLLAALAAALLHRLIG